MAKLNWSTTNSQVTDEIINVSSSAAFSLIHDVFYNKTGKLVVISTGTGGSGTVLTLSTDYTIGGAISDSDLPSSISPDVAYTTIAITNAAYHSTDLYVSYYPLGDYVEAEDFTQLAIGIRLTAKDISSANQTTDLTIYEPGGSSYVQDGTKIHVSWTGGDATYYHKFTTTSGWTLYNDFVDLAPGDGSATFAWCGYGSGGLTLIKDEANSRWIVETDGVFDRGGDFESGGYWEQRTDKSLMVREFGTTLRTTDNASGSVYSGDADDFTFIIPFDSAPYSKPKCKQNTGSVWAVTRESEINTATAVRIRVVGGSTSNKGYSGYESEGEWRD